MTTDTHTILPDADDLDTRDCPRDYTVALYLIPAEESEHGRPEVTYHAGVGNIGWPIAAHNNRWASIGSYGAGAVGEAVRAVLEAMDAELVEASDAYEGIEWDGSNYRGRWAAGEVGCEAKIEMQIRFGALREEIAYAWDADEWLGGWEDFHVEASPLRDLDAAVAGAVDALEDDAAEAYITRDALEAALRRAAEAYRDDPERWLEIEDLEMAAEPDAPAAAWALAQVEIEGEEYAVRYYLAPYRRSEPSLGWKPGGESLDAWADCAALEGFSREVIVGVGEALIESADADFPVLDVIPAYVRR